MSSMKYCMFENLLSDVEEIMGDYYEGKFETGLSQSEFEALEWLHGMLPEFQDIIGKVREIGVKNDR